MKPADYDAIGDDYKKHHLVGLENPTLDEWFKRVIEKERNTKKEKGK